jgi:hypothetical protein
VALPHTQRHESRPNTPSHPRDMPRRQVQAQRYGSQVCWAGRPSEDEFNAVGGEGDAARIGSVVAIAPFHSNLRRPRPGSPGQLEPEVLVVRCTPGSPRTPATETDHRSKRTIARSLYAVCQVYSNERCIFFGVVAGDRTLMILQVSALMQVCIGLMEQWVVLWRVRNEITLAQDLLRVAPSQRSCLLLLYLMELTSRSLPRLFSRSTDWRQRRRRRWQQQ